MADSKITALTSISTSTDPAVDPLVIVDVSDTSMAASGTSKKVTLNNLLSSSPTASGALTVTGLVTAGSATITGDLTVDTSTLKVDSTNNRVGIGTASPTVPLYVTGNNATATAIMQDETNGAKLRLLANSINFDITNGGGGGEIAVSGANPLTFKTNGSERARIDSSGNVGVGVVPSAWDTAVFKAIQIGTGVGQATVVSRTDNVNNTAYGLNYYYGTGNYRYIAAGRATNYEQASGKHYWNIDSGTQVANAATSFTQAMTLDASGNLLVKKTAVSQSTLGCELTATGQVNGATAGLDNLNIYNTTASAYRFYVNAAGTVFATNTVISAISDSRLKENVQDIDVGLAAILSLKPRKFDWKAGKGKGIKGDRGFIAQEFETVFPNLIDEWKDPAPEGEAPYKSVRADLIPVLVKAIQELTARVQTLEAR